MSGKKVPSHCKSLVMRLTDKRLHSKSGIHNTPVSFTPPRRGQSHFPSTGMASPLGITTGGSKCVTHILVIKLGVEVMSSVQPKSMIQSSLPTMLALRDDPSSILEFLK